MAKPAPNRLQNLQNLRTADIDGALATAFASLVTGAFITGFINRLGGSDQTINLAGALPALIGIAQIPGAVVGRRFRSYKKFVGPGGILWRLLYVPFVFLPLVAFPHEAKVWVLLACIALASLATLFVAPLYNEWIADMVPSSSRGFYFARRGAILSGTGATAGLLGGFILDWFRSRGQEDIGFSVVFGLGILCAAASLVFFLRMHDTERVNVSREPLGSAFKALRNPFVDRSFRKVMLFLGVFVFGQGFAGNLFGAFAIKSLHMPYASLQWCGVMHATGNVIASRFWGYLGDKYGNKPLLYIAGFLLTITPLMWMFCEPDQLVRNNLLLLPSHVLVGAVWSGVALTQFNIVLSTAKSEDRANYLGVIQTVQSITGFAAPMAGAAMMGMVSLTNSQEHSYKMVFGATMLLRLFAMMFLFPVREAGAARVTIALRDLTRLTPSGLRAMKDLKAPDVEQREHAIASVGELGTTIAASEVISALQDPSPRIRRQAALTLARLQNRDAARALADQLVNQPDLVEEEAVDALGLLGGSEHVEPLLHLLESPRPMMRRAAAKALARIGDQRAVEALMRAADDTSEPDLQRSALQALRILGASEGEPAIGRALFSRYPSVRIAAAEAAAELELESLAPALRATLSEFSDDASAEAAYALGVTGDRQDLALILEAARRAAGSAARRRCLLGCARLLGCEREAYRLLTSGGMARDKLLMDTISPMMKGNKRLRTALALYSDGKEHEALATISLMRRFPELIPFGEQPAEEAFLVAASFMRKASAGIKAD